LLTEEERKKQLEPKDMVLDIGARDGEEALSMGVRPGDPVAPFSPFADLGNGRLLGKALDDRVGCAMVIEVLRQLAECDHPNTVYAVGTTHEEVGLLGAQTSAFAVAPQVAIVAEVTVANDVPGSTQDGGYSELGKGVGLCIRDAGLIPNRRLREFVAGVAEEAGIPTQYVAMERGRTDGTRVQVHGEGVPTLYIGPPARYVHSHAGLMDVDDFDKAVKLLVEVIRRLDQETVTGLTRYDL
jgi:endoglucanase